MTNTKMRGWHHIHPLQSHVSHQWAPFSLSDVVVFCSMLQCVAVRCSALQCIAVHCSASLCVAALTDIYFFGMTKWRMRGWHHTHLFRTHGSRRWVPSSQIWPVWIFRIVPTAQMRWLISLSLSFHELLLTYMSNFVPLPFHELYSSGSVPITLMRCLVYVSLSFHELLLIYMSNFVSLPFHELYSSASVALYLSHWWGDSSTYLSLLTNCIFIYPFICHSLSTNLTRLDFRIVPTALMRWLVYAFLSFHELYLFSTCISRSLFTNWTRLDCLNCTDCTDEVARPCISLFSRASSFYVYIYTSLFSRTWPVWTRHSVPTALMRWLIPVSLSFHELYLHVFIYDSVPTALMKWLIHVFLSPHKLYLYMCMHIYLSFHELVPSRSVILDWVQWWGKSYIYIYMCPPTNMIFICICICICKCICMCICICICICICMCIFMRMCMYICIFICICTFIFICICICICECICICICICMYICICMCTCMCMCICIFIYICSFICACTCIYICTHTYIHVHVYVCMYAYLLSRTLI